MRGLIAVLAVLLASCGGPAAPAKTEDATAELRPLMEKLMADWGTLDPSNVAKYYAKDPGLPFYDVAPLKYSGWQEYESGSKKTFSDWKSIKITMGPDFKASRNGDIAWATFTSLFEITPKTGEVLKGSGPQHRGSGKARQRLDHRARTCISAYAGCPAAAVGEEIARRLPTLLRSAFQPADENHLGSTQTRPLIRTGRN